MQVELDEQLAKVLCTRADRMWWMERLLYRSIIGLGETLALQRAQ